MFTTRNFTLNEVSNNVAFSMLMLARVTSGALYPTPKVAQEVTVRMNRQINNVGTNFFMDGLPVSRLIRFRM